jgi:autotransporter adhesin
MTKYLLLAATAAIGASFALSSPARAGDVCELDGTGSLGGATAGGTGAQACGINADASGDFSTAIGFNAKAAGENGTAVGSDASAGGAGSVALGQGAQTNFDNSIVIDSSNAATTQVGGDDAIAIGNAAVAGATESIAMGHNSIASGASAVAIGPSSNATGGATVAIGVGSNATLSGAVALGFGSQAQGKNAVALGNSATVSGVNGIAVGSGSTVAGDGSLAVGHLANASGKNSVALGQGSVADEDNVVSVGADGSERRVTNVAAGVNDTDAVNVGQLNAAIASVSAFVPSILQGQIDGLQFSLDTLSGDVRRNRQEARRGTAAAVAMSEAPMPSRDGGISYSLHGASYRGNMAVGASVKYRINRAAAIDFGISSAGHKDTAVRLGVSGEF